MLSVALGNAVSVILTPDKLTALVNARVIVAVVGTSGRRFAVGALVGTWAFVLHAS